MSQQESRQSVRAHSHGDLEAPAHNVPISPRSKNTLVEEAVPAWVLLFLYSKCEKNYETPLWLFCHFPVISLFLPVPSAVQRTADSQ